FYSYTPLELLIIEQLMKSSKRVTLTLPLDKPFHQYRPSDLDLFRLTGETCQSLYEIMQLNGIECEEEVVLSKQYRWNNDSLKHLETHFDSRPTRKFDGETRLHIVEAANRRAEVEGVARKIRKLAREK
ncbi:hypothetical protein, partial [Enterococcus faecium]|uniref:hypothetical protein n=1 Tax=Enterococcus faecium TaxID=1352 RepID=UPI0030C849B3